MKCSRQRQVSPKSPSCTCDRILTSPSCTAVREEENKTVAGRNVLWIPGVLTKPVTAVSAAPSQSSPQLLPMLSTPLSPSACLLQHSLQSHSTHSSFHLSGQQTVITDMQTLQPGHLDLHSRDCQPLSQGYLGFLDYKRN